MKLLPYLLILRPKNLVIIVLTLTVLQYGVIRNFPDQSPVLSLPYFIIFVLITLLITGTGNLVNDIFDRHTDVVNKPGKAYIPRDISLKNAWNYYYMLVLLGLILAVWLSIKSNHVSDVWMYPVSVGILYLYAKYFKSTILVGNILVSAFIAFVWGILFYIQFSGTNKETLHLIYNQHILNNLCIPYMIFAFLINILREMVKDIEDLEGDKMNDIHTLPVVYSLKTAKIIISFITIMLLFSILYWVFTSTLTLTFEIRFFYLIFIVSPIFLILAKIWSANQKKEYHFISKVLKMVMIFALTGMLFITKNGISL